MRRSIGAMLAAVVLASVIPLATVQAAPGISVSLDVATTLGTPSGGPFTAAGAAVDAGLVCPSGATMDVGLAISGNGKTGTNYHVLKNFVCDDGSGSFLLKMQVRADRKGGFTWLVVSGIGNYLGLQGSGTGYSVSLGGSELLDRFYGTVH